MPPAGAVDPLAVGLAAEQFQQIASTALQDVAQLKMPAVTQPLADAVGKAMGTASASRKSHPQGLDGRQATGGEEAGRGARSPQANGRPTLSRLVLTIERSRVGTMKLFPSGYRHPSAMAHGGRPRAGPAARADGAVLDYASAPTLGLLYITDHYAVDGAGDPRPPERRAARGDRLGRHRGHRRVGQQCRVLRRARR